ncbi:MAG: lipoprotein [Pseudomonadota bacterium]|nr:lipoprotein [Xanthomonadaceae bacterium]MDE2249088.1 lipoprotein [Xanthomonadaceae bacterium]MDE3209342.1 lipoprotein [Pseudomonadota bacterium]
MRRSLLLLLFVAVAALLAGCGNKGPLVLPPTKPLPAPAAAATVAPASSARPTAGQP